MKRLVVAILSIMLCFCYVLQEELVSANITTSVMQTSSERVAKTIYKGSSLRDVAKGENLYVAVGDYGNIMTSTDGVNWDQIPFRSNVTLTSVMWVSNDKQFVAAGSTILTSPDGVNWTERTSEFKGTINDTAHSNSWYVAVGKDGLLLISRDGVTWTKNNISSGEDLYSIVTKGSSFFIAVGENALYVNLRQATVQVNGEGYSRKETILQCEERRIEEVKAEDIMSIAGVDLGYSMICSNGWAIAGDDDKWSSGRLFDSVPIASGSSGVTSGNALYKLLASDYKDCYYYTADGLVARVKGPKLPGRNDFVKVIVNDGSNFDLKKINWFNGQFIGVGTEGRILTSPDGVNWINRTPTYEIKDPPAISSISEQIGNKVDIKVVVNGNVVKFDVPPMTINSRTMVPLRAIFEALGAEIQWLEESRAIIGIKGTSKVVLKIDDTNAYVNDELRILDAPPVIINSRTLVPVRFISESLGAKVEWDSVNRIVYITS